MPFAVERSEGVLTLTLETPGSPINIFNHATAHQLIGVLSEVTPANTRAIVFATAKTNSFINGVGLLLAQAARDQEDVRRASTPPWTAYRMVREAPVPTIAVIEGNCFGCGVEFVLGCDYRMAVDTWETQFYMTELNDYLFMPLFGSTWNLPETVGLADAIDLLLWGERWDAATALARGLVDEVVPCEQVEERRAEILARVLAGAQRTRRRGRVAWGEHEDRVAEKTRRRIAALPSPYQPLYTEALTLLESGARQTHGYLEQQQRELVQSGASAMSPMGKAAYAFFYLRQMASERAAGRARGGAPGASFAVDVSPEDPARPFVDDLRSRRLRGVGFTTGGARRAGDGPPDGFRLRGMTRRGTEGGGGLEVAIRVGVAAGPEGDVEIYAPAYAAGGRLVELSTRRDAPLDPEATRRLAAVFQRLGFEVARTTPGETFLTTRMLVAFLAPLLCFLERDGEVGEVNATLREGGFVRLPAALLGALESAPLVGLVAGAVSLPAAEIEKGLAALARQAEADGALRPVLLEGLCLSLLEATLAARQGKEIRDTSISDLIARELLDFPRHLCSLGTWLKKARVARALDDPRARDLVGPRTVEVAAGFVAAGREIYR